MLNHSPKPFPDRLGVSTIETKHILVQVTRDLILLKTALECIQDQPFDQGNDRVRRRQSAMLFNRARPKLRRMDAADVPNSAWPLQPSVWIWLLRAIWA